MKFVDRIFRIDEGKLVIQNKISLYAGFIAVLLPVLFVILNNFFGASTHPHNQPTAIANFEVNSRVYWIYFISLSLSVPILSFLWGGHIGAGVSVGLSIPFIILLLFNITSMSHSYGVRSDDILSSIVGLIAAIITCIGITRLGEKIGEARLNLRGKIASSWDHYQDMSAQKNLLHLQIEETKKKSSAMNLLIQKIKSLIDSSSDLAKELDLSKTAKYVAHNAREILGRGRVLVYRYNQTGSSLLYAEPPLQSNESANGEDFNSIVKRRRKNLLLPDISQNYQIAPSSPMERKFNSLILVPLMTGYDVWGVIRVESLQKSDFTRDDLSAIDMLSVPATLALHNADLYSLLAQKAVTDGLTGLYRRHLFEKRIEIEISRARRGGKNLSLIFLDIDYFKSVNDNFGHRVGDLVLKEISAVLIEETVAPGIAARYGGEEFVLLMPETNKKDALEKAEAIRQRVEQKKFEELNRTMTISAGVASYPDDATSSKNLIEQADNAVYMSKRNGRNRVTPA